MLTFQHQHTLPKRNILSGSPHPPKEKYPLQDNTDSGKHSSSNPLECYALSNGNGELNDNCNKNYKVYTDTDSDGKTEITTDINCKFKGKDFVIKVKVDPGSETNCIPLSHFRHLFPQLCRTDGLPKETTLQPTLAQFEAYDGEISANTPKHQYYQPQEDQETFFINTEGHLQCHQDSERLSEPILLGTYLAAGSTQYFTNLAQ